MPSLAWSGSLRFWGKKEADVILDLFALSMLAVDLAGLVRGLIYLLIAALVIAVVVYIVVRLATQFVPGFAPFAWILWAIGGLVLLLVALNVFGPMFGA